MGDADRDYLRRLASTEAGSIFAHAGELVQTFGHIARVIAEGGRSLRTLRERDRLESDHAPARVRASSLRQAYDLALAGAIGAVFGLYLYVELVHAERALGPRRPGRRWRSAARSASS